MCKMKLQNVSAINNFLEQHSDSLSKAMKDIPISYPATTPQPTSPDFAIFFGSFLLRVNRGFQCLRFPGMDQSSTPCQQQRCLGARNERDADERLRRSGRSSKPSNRVDALVNLGEDFVQQGSIQREFPTLEIRNCLPAAMGYFRIKVRNNLFISNDAMTETYWK